MSKARIMAIIWRHIYNFKHSWDRLSDTFYWPAMDILIWGLTSFYIKQSAVAIPNFVLMILSGLVFWIVVWRSQYEISVNILEEMWSHNLVNLFSTPLKVTEWIMAVLFLGAIKMSLAVGFAAFLVWVVYSLKVFIYGWLLLPFVAILLMVGWAIGFFLAGLVVKFGTRIQTVAWSGVYLLAPFSALYYPVSSLPGWAQAIARWVPTSYVFEGMRAVLFDQMLDQATLAKGLILGLIYLILAILFFRMMFNWSRKTGLASLE